MIVGDVNMKNIPAKLTQIVYFILVISYLFIVERRLYNAEQKITLIYQIDSLRYENVMKYMFLNDSLKEQTK